MSINFKFSYPCVVCRNQVSVFAIKREEKNKFIYQCNNCGTWIVLHPKWGNMTFIFFSGTILFWGFLALSLYWLEKLSSSVTAALSGIGVLLFSFVSIACYIIFSFMWMLNLAYPLKMICLDEKASKKTKESNKASKDVNH